MIFEPESLREIVGSFYFVHGAKTMNKGEYYARKQILELFDYDWQHDCDIGIRTWSGSGSAVVYIDCAIDS